jgi:hypothetical protein
MSIKHFDDTIGNRNCDLPACSAVPQPTAPPAAYPQTPSTPRQSVPFYRNKLDRSGFSSRFSLNHASFDLIKRIFNRLRLKCDGTRAETRFRLSAKRTSPFKLAGASVQWTTGSRGVRTSGSNAGYTMFRGSVKSTGYPLHLPVFPSLFL